MKHIMTSTTSVAYRHGQIVIVTDLDARLRSVHVLTTESGAFITGEKYIGRHTKRRRAQIEAFAWRGKVRR